jgi:hypothetical protein
LTVRTSDDFLEFFVQVGFLQAIPQGAPSSPITISSP